MSSIFISYRRTGTSGYGGRLQDDLGKHFGRNRVFRDIDSIRPGTEFAQVIDQAIAEAGIVLALIGRNWLNATNKRRLNDPHDFVRLEIESALKQGIVVLPVLIEGARIPSPERLPESISRLGRTQGIELSDDRWAYDLDRLVKVLEEIVGSPSGPTLHGRADGEALSTAPPDGGGGVGTAPPAVPPPRPSPAAPGAPLRPLPPKRASASRPSAAVATPAVAARPPGTVAKGPRLVLVDQRGRPVGSDEHPVVVARPGERTPAGVRVRNCGQVPDAIELRVEGCPSEWLVLDPVVNLEREGTQEMMVLLSPPREWATRPGFYGVRVTAHGLNGQAVKSNRVRLRVRVPEFTAPVAAVVDGPPAERTCRTRLLRATDAAFAISVQNHGNGPLEAQLSVRADDLVTRVWPASVSVAAGGEAQARVRATPRRRWVGAASARSVTVAVAWDTGDEPMTLVVPLTHRPLLSLRGGGRGSRPVRAPGPESGHDPAVAVAVTSSSQPPSRSSQGET